MHIGFLSVKIDTPLPKERQKKNHKGQERLPSGGAVACKATERGLLKALTSN